MRVYSETTTTTFCVHQPLLSNENEGRQKCFILASGSIFEGGVNMALFDPVIALKQRTGPPNYLVCGEI